MLLPSNGVCINDVPDPDVPAIAAAVPVFAVVVDEGVNVALNCNMGLCRCRDVTININVLSK